MSERPDPHAQWWSLIEVAAELGVKPDTVSAYVHRGQMPKPEIHLGRAPGWKPATIRKWMSGRPGRGKRTAR